MSGTGDRKARGRSSAGFLCVLLLASPGLAQEGPDPDDAPVLGRPTEHFYNIVGRTVTAEWSADRTAVPEGGELALTLTIRGATNPHRVRRPNLRELSAFRERFEVADAADPPAGKGAKEVRFRYTLRPRSSAVDRVPELPVAYQLPPPSTAPARTTYAKALPIRVVPRAAAAPPSGPLEAPERFFHLATDYRAPTEPGWAGWLGLLALIPVTTALWVVLWHLWNPEGARLARLRRNRAVARALDALARAEKSADPAANAAAAVRVYLIERWGMPPAATVPAEVAAALAAPVGWAESSRPTGPPSRPRVGLEDSAHPTRPVLPTDRAAAVVEFFRKCDAARFAPEGNTGVLLVEDARQMILDWEQ